MSIKKELAKLSKVELQQRYKARVNELVKFRVSLDPSVISTGGGVTGLEREIRSIGQLLAHQGKGE